MSRQVISENGFFVMMVDSDNTTTLQRESIKGRYGGSTKHDSSKLLLFDTGASVHDVTPSDKFLFNPQFFVADEGSTKETESEASFIQ
jgi:hypothetical protein